MILTAIDVARVAKQAGFTGSALVTAVAVARAESGFNSTAVGDVDLTQPGEKSVGLWQINYRPTRDQLGGMRDPTLNLQPFHNAVAAFMISGRGASFGPWSTYTSGAYKRFLSEAAAAVEEVAHVASKLVGICPAPNGGYWILADDGAVYAFGGAPYCGRLTLDPNGVWLPEIPK